MVFFSLSLARSLPDFFSVSVLFSFLLEGCNLHSLLCRHHARDDRLGRRFSTRGKCNQKKKEKSTTISRDSLGPIIIV